MAELQVKDRVKVSTLNGVFTFEGIIVNINDFREPDLKYAVDVGTDDFVFVAESQLEKIEKENE